MRDRNDLINSLFAGRKAITASLKQCEGQMTALVKGPVVRGHAPPLLEGTRDKVCKGQR